MRQFKHKTLWWMAEHFNTWVVEWYKISDKKWLLVFWDEWTSKENLIELWFEEVVEKDWIENVITELVKLDRDMMPQEREEVRRAIETHAPKTKKFTRQEVREIQLKLYNEDYMNIYEVLESLNLLSSSDE